MKTVALLITVVMWGGCRSARAAAPVDGSADVRLPDPGDEPARTFEARLTPPDMDGKTANVPFTCGACTCGDSCVIGGEGGPGTGEIDYSSIFLSALAAARGSAPHWKGPPAAETRSASARVVVHVSSVSPGSERNAVRRVVAGHLGEVRACYQRELLRHPGLRGRIEIEFVVDPATKVADILRRRSAMTEAPGVAFCDCAQRIMVVAPPRERGEVLACIESMMLGWVFRSARPPAAVSVSQSFDLAPDQSPPLPQTRR